MKNSLPYDPGALASEPAPVAGEMISLRVEGLPPYKDEHFSIRNPRHKIHSRFRDLRQAAIEAMAGRAPYGGAVGLDFVMYAPEFEKKKTLIDYVGGIMDTLDGSHGVHFTYLPIVYEDDCQVARGTSKLQSSANSFYEIMIRFLPETMDREPGAAADPARRSGFWQ